MNESYKDLKVIPHSQHSRLAVKRTGEQGALLCDSCELAQRNQLEPATVLS
jgi:hypothetical protein